MPLVTVAGDPDLVALLKAAVANVEAAEAQRWARPPPPIAPPAYCPSSPKAAASSGVGPKISS